MWPAGNTAIALGLRSRIWRDAEAVHLEVEAPHRAASGRGQLDLRALRTLSPEEWVDTDVIDGWFRLLQKRSHNSQENFHGQLPKCTSFGLDFVGQARAMLETGQWTKYYQEIMVSGLILILGDSMTNKVPRLIRQTPTYSFVH